MGRSEPAATSWTGPARLPSRDASCAARNSMGSRTPTACRRRIGPWDAWDGTGWPLRSSAVPGLSRSTPSSALANRSNNFARIRRPDPSRPASSCARMAMRGRIVLRFCRCSGRRRHSSRGAHTAAGSGRRVSRGSMSQYGCGMCRRGSWGTGGAGISHRHHPAAGARPLSRRPAALPCASAARNRFAVLGEKRARGTTSRAGRQTAVQGAPPRGHPRWCLAGTTIPRWRALRSFTTRRLPLMGANGTSLPDRRATHSARAADGGIWHRAPLRVPRSLESATGAR